MIGDLSYGIHHRGSIIGDLSYGDLSNGIYRRGSIAGDLS